MAGIRGWNRATRSAGIVLALLTGCDTAPSAPQSRPVEAGPPAATQAAAVEPPPEPALAADYTEWTRAMALDQLRDSDDPVMRRSAAVRLVQLASSSPLALPEALPDSFAADLVVLALGDFGWVLGVRGAVFENEDLGIEVRAVQMPVLLDAEGAVRGGPEYYIDLAQFYPSRDADVFPHLLVTPERVLVLDEAGLRSAVVARNLQGGWFAWEFNGGYPYIAVRHPQAEDGEVTRYRWDPYELVFMGPQMEAMPEGADTLMAIDLSQSRMLIPVGGYVPVVEAAEREPEIKIEDEPVELPPF